MRIQYLILILWFPLTACVHSGQDRLAGEKPQIQPVIINFGTMGEQGSFQRTDWHRFRDSLTINGILSPEFFIEKSLPKADWHMFLWMETGFDQGPDRLGAELFSYDTEPVIVTLKSWQLRNGAYTLTVGEESTVISITGRGQSLPVTIVPGEPINISLHRTRTSN